LDPFAIPDDRPRSNRAKFNPSLSILSSPKGNRFVSLIRVFGEENTYSDMPRNEGNSAIHRAIFAKDGMTLEEITQEPVLSSNLDAEDPRDTCIEGIHYITYIETFKDRDEKRMPSVGFRPALAATVNFREFCKRELRGLPDYVKDFVIFPETFNDNYVALFSPRVPAHHVDDPAYRRLSSSQGIWSAYSKNMKDWTVSREILAPERSEAKIGAGSPPIKTSYGWLLPYHSVRTKQDSAGKVYERNYSLRFALIDLQNPSIVRLITGFVMEPEKDYERFNSNIPDLKHVFVTGAEPCTFRNGSDMQGILMAYGAADKYCARAFITTKHIKEIIHEALRGN
jgi:predicted GH43/DUF377 family glycosyl hydrolase